MPWERFKRGEITKNEYKNLLAKRKGFANRIEQDKAWLENKGFKTYKDYELYLAQKKGFLTTKEYKDFLAQQKGFKNSKEYYDFLAQQKGFKNNSDYVNNLNHKRGDTKPMSENKSCSQYLGVHIAERVLSHVFESVTRMPILNPGYDFICKKGYKINVKSACITKNNLTKIWNFYIRKNTIPDYFLLLAFDNRTDLNPLHIWLIKGTDKIGIKIKSILNEKNSLHICNTFRSIEAYEKYEIEDKLKKMISCCDSLKG